MINWSIFTYISINEEKQKEFYLKFQLPEPIENKVTLGDILNVKVDKIESNYQRNLFGEIIQQHSMSLSNNNGFNDYFLFIFYLYY